MNTKEKAGKDAPGRMGLIFVPISVLSDETRRRAQVV